MAKVLLICDSHAGIRNDAISFNEYFKKCYDWMFNIIDEQNIKHIIHLGDLFDRRKYVNFLTASRVRKDFLEQIDKRNISTHIIVGNHDIYWKNTTDVNALTELVGDRYKNIKIYTEPTLIDIDYTLIQLIPWICQSNYINSINAINNSKSDILMGHLELQGFEMHRNIVSDHGLDPLSFARYDMVFSGHFHHKSENNNIHYLGAFAEYTWTDYNDPRGIHIFDTATREITFYQNPHKMFHMMVYDDSKPDVDIMNTINNIDYSKYEGTYVRVVVSNKTNAYAFDLFLENLYKASPVDISIVEDISSFRDDMENENIDQTEDTPSILRKYIDGLTLPVDSDKMKTFMQNIYFEALKTETLN